MLNWAAHSSVLCQESLWQKGRQESVAGYTAIMKCQFSSALTSYFTILDGILAIVSLGIFDEIVQNIEWLFIS